MIINRSFKEFKFRHRSKENQVIYTSKKVKNDNEVLNLINNFYANLKEERRRKSPFFFDSIRVKVETFNMMLGSVYHDRFKLWSDTKVKL